MLIGFVPLLVVLLEAVFRDAAAVSDVASPSEDAWLG